MNDLENNLWPGKVTINEETFDIYKSRISCTPHKDAFLINFWMQAEDCESRNNVFPPTIEIRTKTKVNLLTASTVELDVPSEEEADEAWHEDYFTGYYDGMHQYLEQVNIKFSRIEDDLFSVEFSGVPEMYKSVKGHCKLNLRKTLNKHW